jgi:hypothetical protein
LQGIASHIPATWDAERQALTTVESATACLVRRKSQSQRGAVRNNHCATGFVRLEM